MHSPAEYNPHKDTTHYNFSPAEYEFPSTSPDVSNFIVISNFISRRRHLSPTGCVSVVPFSPAAAVSRLETWSDSASEETYISYSPARDFDGLQIPPTRSPGSYQLLSSRIYTQDSPVEYLLASPQRSLHMRFTATCSSVSTIHGSI